MYKVDDTTLARLSNTLAMAELMDITSMPVQDVVRLKYIKDTLRTCITTIGCSEIDPDDDDEVDYSMIPGVEDIAE